ncbi:hypothetical protein BDL97_01G156300 [Sphagnum fallax]|nr:hypothetical protein BDL97_01G156300 [Sphagnum fallax]KAH8975415.1 hypothetical protein BDL97_01G156300 [Sphagnum fallax]
MAWQQVPPQGPGGGGYDPRFGQQTGGVPAAGGANNPFNDVLYGASSGILGTYLGNSKEYVQSNVSRYFATHDVQYYFQVNDQYVKNKLKVVLFPFLHKGHWTRIAEQVAGGLKYKPPRHDINAPDLYLPLMAFSTYVVLCGLTLGMAGKFTPDVMGALFTKAVLGWAVETILLKSSLFALGSSDAPLLDVVAYGGYSFIGVSVSVLASMLWSYAYYITLPWTSLCMANFLVRTMKRLLFAEARSYDRDSTRHHYLLLLMGVAQFPLFYWLVRVR